MPEQPEERSEGVKRAIAFMLRRDKPGIAKRTPVPEPELVIGEQSGEGIFLGTWQPKDRDGDSLGKIFNVFAAPQDLADESGNKKIYTYKNTVKRISELKDWNGFDGTNYATDKELYQALKDDSYNGGWIIPTIDLLAGSDIDGNKDVQKDNLFKHQDTGSFKGTFTIAASSGSVCPVWYWSSTEVRDDSSYVRGVRFSDGYEGWGHKDIIRLSCRPVRLVNVPGQ